MTDTEVKDLIKQGDEDGDGKINYLGKYLNKIVIFKLKVVALR